MRVLVTGAYGFIGRYVVQALRAVGAEVVGAGRDLELGQRLLPDIEWRHADFNELLTEAGWRPVLAGIDAIVNTVGILQSTAHDDARRIQVTATSALFEAAATAGIRRVVHVSAISVEPGVETDYARTRVAAEARLRDLDLDWVIVKPSLVIGEGSHGGTSLLRGVAGLPFVTPVPEVGSGRFQPIAMRDVAEGIARLALSPSPSRLTLYAAGPEPMDVGGLARTYRRWLGFAERPILKVPLAVMAPALWAGDAAARLGSPSALRTASLEQMRYAETFDPTPFEAVLGRPLTAVAELLPPGAASIQDRLHARLYFLRPLMQGVLALFWIATGLITLLPGPRTAAIAMASAAGLNGAMAGFAVIGGAIADIVAGALMLNARWTRPAGLLQLGLIGLYLVIGTWLTPSLWADPLGPLMKIVPIAVLTLAVMALAEER